jgi:uncharacterized protein YndB with AHSA1/START domain
MAREIWHELFFAVSPVEVHAALTDPEKLARWWTTEVRGAAIPGQRMEFGFGRLTQEVIVGDVTRPTRVEWVPTEKGLPDWVHTRIVFEISRRDARTILQLRHTNWADDARLYALCNTDWAFYLLSLRELLEKGKGRPYPDDFMGFGLLS